MNREKANFIIDNNTLDGGRINATIAVSVANRIFNEFESRVCENCKYLENMTSIEFPYFVCKNKKVGDKAVYLNVGLDFGCNKWLAEGEVK